jgi:hypothetical protein
VEDRATESNLSSPNRENGDKEERNISEEELKCLEVLDKRKKPEFLMRNRCCKCYETKVGDTDVDGDKCFLLSLLPSFWKFKDEQKNYGTNGNCGSYETGQIFTKCANLSVWLLAFLSKRKQCPTK